MMQRRSVANNAASDSELAGVLNVPQGGAGYPGVE
jgi:hypothetical protein